ALPRRTPPPSEDRIKPVAPTLDDRQQKQLQQAEELLFSGPPAADFARDLFFGRFLQEAILPFPRLSAEEQAIGDAMVAETERFARSEIDPAAIDRQADIPPAVIRGLGRVGVLGATIPPE